jgi:hypothetical protein
MDSPLEPHTITFTGTNPLPVGNAAFHPTIETVGFQTAFSVINFFFSSGPYLPEYRCMLKISQFLQMSEKPGPMFDVSNYHSFTSDDNLPPQAKLRFKFSIEQNALITHSLL